jgi:hypothetical protein
MSAGDLHLSDEDLLLAADGELSQLQMKQVSEHLAACWDCRVRRERLDATIAGIVHARHAILDTQLPPSTGGRALLKAHLSEFAANSKTSRWSRFVPGTALRRVRAIGFASVALVAIAVLATVYRARMQGTSSTTTRIPLEPSRRLTPGATRQVSLREVCSTAPDDGSARVISVSQQEQVFREYGMDGAPAKDYEVDFLITPELGGSNDIHNLWPEPYYSTEWNAHVKDELEDRLHQMVCDGKLDLSTAQQDISSDWIMAYKKYFHTDRPL